MTTTKSQLNLYREPSLSHPTLLVGWQTQDVGNLGTGITSYIKETSKRVEVAELDPPGFFAFEGALFKDNLIQIPQSKFWECPEKNLLLFSSEEPMYEKYSFLTTILDFCLEYYGVPVLYTFNGNPAAITHQSSRRIYLVFNRESLREEFPEDHLIEHVNWEGHPAMSTYLLWVAQKKGITGVTLWVEVPFYLASVEDPLAIKCLLSFLNQQLNLQLNFEVLDQKISYQEQLLDELSETNPTVKEKLQKLEKEQELEENEQVFLSKKVYDHLQVRGER